MTENTAELADIGEQLDRYDGGVGIGEFTGTRVDLGHKVIIRCDSAAQRTILRTRWVGQRGAKRLRCPECGRMASVYLVPGAS
jgi:hypothetical protein